VGLRNLDLSLGLSEEPAIPFTAVMRGDYDLKQATVHPKFPNLRFLTAPVTEEPESIDLDDFGDLIDQARQEFDFCLIDAPAGVGAGFKLAVRYADLALVVTGGEPAALRDGARTVLCLETCSRAEAKVIVNRIRPKLFKRRRLTVDDCMDAVGLPLLGIVPEDEEVTFAAAAGQALISRTKTGAAQACRHIARRLAGERQPLLKLQMR
jgi:septum site-determining protein MinD